MSGQHLAIDISGKAQQKGCGRNDQRFKAR